MYTTEELSDYLKKEGAEFEMIRQETPILSTRDAEKYFDTALAAPACRVFSTTVYWKTRSYTGAAATAYVR